MLELGITMALDADRIGARLWEQVVNPEQTRRARRKTRARHDWRARVGFRTNRAGQREVMTPGLRQQPVIARIWTGRTRSDVADEYLAYSYEHGVREIKKKPGNLGVQLFRKINGDIAEFTTISYWRSMDDMRAMHGTDGGDLRRAAHLERDSEYLLELPDFVEIAELHAID